MEIRDKRKAGKSHTKQAMKKITREILGKKWDDETCDFTYDVVVEAIKRTISEYGTLTIEGLCKFQIDWLEEQQKYDSINNNGEFRTIPGHSIIRIHGTPSYKKQIKDSDIKYVSKTGSDD